MRGDRAYLSGHVPLNPDGSFAGPFGKVGAEVSPEQGYEAAWLTVLAMLGNLNRALRDLDRVSAWLRVFGMVNSAPGFDRQPNVINGFSNLILELNGPERSGAPQLRGLLRLSSSCPFHRPIHPRSAWKGSSTKFALEDGRWPRMLKLSI